MTGLALLSGCGGRSDKYVNDGEAGVGGSGAIATGGAPTGGASTAGGSSGNGGTTGGSSNAIGGTGAVGGSVSVDGGGGGIAGSGANGGTGAEGGSTSGTGPDGGTGGVAHGGSAGFAQGGVSGGAHGGEAGGGAGGRSGAGGSAGTSSCQSLEDAYDAALQDAETCDPNAPEDQCTQKLSVGLNCGCDGFVNPKYADEIASLSSLAQQWSGKNCRSAVCGACLAPIRGQCSAQGQCEGVPPGPGRSCKVAGKVYADGESKIPDPVSCNTCSCNDGQLACTDIGGCEKPCPDGYGYGTDCAECGPTDACLVPEYDCFKQCGDGCTDPGTVCIQGLCVAGFC